ncbi:MAG TPA: M20 family peptidase [Novosphingobium sp.]|nr:M20 family peptidase [Novosphingobium sp.]
MKKWVLGLGVALLALGGTVAARTAMFQPGEVADGSKITVAAAAPFDVNRAAQNLGQAVRFRTVSNQDAAQNQTAEWDKLQAWLATTYPKAHAAMNQDKIGQTLVYSWTGSDPAAQPVIMMAHQDVVPVTAGTEKDWKHDPFGGVIAEGAVWGRGTVDDKGSLIALFEALEALAAQGFKPKRTIYLVSGHDEEVGGTGAAAAAKWLAKRKVKALFTLDEGGLITTDTPVIGKPAMMIGVAEKGYVTLQVRAPAVGGHSSMPPAEIGTVNLSKAVVAIHADQHPMELRGPVGGMIDVLASEAGGMTKVAAANKWLLGGQIISTMAKSPSSAAMLHTTVAPTMLEGSPKENVLPQSASALINYRIAPWDSSAEVLKRARAAVEGLPVEVAITERGAREPTPVSSSTSLGWQLIVASAQAGHKGVIAAPYLVVGGTDSRNMTPVSDDVYRFMPIALSTAETKMIHGTNEHMTLKNLESMIAFYTRLLATAAG